MRLFATYLFVSIAFLGTKTLSGQTSGSSDTIVLSTKDAIKVLSKGLEAKALEAQRDLLLVQVDTLKARIAIKEMIASDLSGQVGYYKNIIQSHENIINTMKEQRTLLESQIADKNKELKKQRRKTRLTAFIGLLTTSASIYFLITK